MKKQLQLHWPMLATLFFFFCYYCFYVYQAYSVNVPWLATLTHFYVFDLYYQGKLTLFGATQYYAEHTMLGNNLLMLLNAITTGYTVLWDNYLFPIIFSLSSILVYFSFKKCFPLKQAPFYYLSLLFVFHSVTQRSGQGMDTTFVIASLWAIAIFLLIEKYQGKESLFFYLTLAFLMFTYTFLWAGGYSAGVFFALPLYLLFFWKQEPITKKIILLLFVFSCIALYSAQTHYILKNPYISFNFIEKLKFLITHPLIYPKYILTSIAAGITFGQGNKFHLILGFFLFSSFAYLFIKERKKIPPLVVLFFGYGLGIATAISIGRNFKDYMWTTSSWYLHHWKFYILALIWLALLHYARKKSKFSLFVLGVIFCVNISSQITVWQGAPQMKKHWETLENFALNYHELDHLKEDELTPFLLNKKDTRHYLNILKKYNLGPYEKKSY